MENKKRYEHKKLQKKIIEYGLNGQLSIPNSRIEGRGKIKREKLIGA
jgi:hypothetical protein